MSAATTAFRWVDCVYDVVSGEVFYLLMERGAEERIGNEYDALEWLGGTGGYADPTASDRLRLARRVQGPVIMNTDRTAYADCEPHEFPVLIDGEEHWHPDAEYWRTRRRNPSPEDSHA